MSINIFFWWPAAFVVVHPAATKSVWLLGTIRKKHIIEGNKMRRSSNNRSVIWIHVFIFYVLFIMHHFVIRQWIHISEWWEQGRSFWTPKDSSNRRSPLRLASCSAALLPWNNQARPGYPNQNYKVSCHLLPDLWFLHLTLDYYYSHHLCSMSVFRKLK